MANLQLDSPQRGGDTGRFRSAFARLYQGLITGGLIGSSLILASQMAWSRPVLNDTTHFLVAQRVVDGLPPPPPVIFGQESLANAQNQVAQSQRYLVVVNGDSKMVLSQVQQVQPTASVQEYNGQRFIQAGMFNDANSAQQQVKTLGASGITAQVVPVGTSVVSQTPTYDPGSSASPSSPSAVPSGSMPLPPPEGMPTTTVPASPGSAPSSSPREVEFGGSAPSSASPSDLPNNSSTQTRRGGRAYYVIIPGSSEKLPAITNQVSRLTQGVGVDGMVQTGTARGSHVRVGPFNSRSAADRWSRYFRDFGMDARVSLTR